MIEDIHGEAGVEVQLVEEEVVGVDGEDVVRLEHRLEEALDVEGDDDLGAGAYGSSEYPAVFRVVGHAVDEGLVPVTIASGNEWLVRAMRRSTLSGGRPPP